MKVALLNSGGQLSYLQGLVSGLAQIDGLEIQVLDSDQSIGKFDTYRKIRHVNLVGSDSHSTGSFGKTKRILSYYLEIFVHCLISSNEIIHIQWYRRFYIFDRVFLSIFFKIFNKKIIYTAHNINRGERDGRDSFLNRSSLQFLYSISDVIIVHTEKMKLDLLKKFKVKAGKIHVVPHGINNAVPEVGMSMSTARVKLNIPQNRRVVLFFGRIDRYKGLDVLLSAFSNLDPERYLLLIAGSVVPEYLTEFRSSIEPLLGNKGIISKIGYIPDENIEYYFMAADCLVLPYKYIYQTGVVFLSYRFGLPIIASDVGSLREDIVEGRTGFICRPEDPVDLAHKIEKYFESTLFKNKEYFSVDIKRWAEEKYGWGSIGEKTWRLYKKCLGERC